MKECSLIIQFIYLNYFIECSLPKYLLFISYKDTFSTIISKQNNNQQTTKPQWSWLSNNDKCVLKNNWAITILLWIKKNSTNRRKLNMNKKYNTLSWYWIFIVLNIQCCSVSYKIWKIFNSIFKTLVIFLRKYVRKYEMLYEPNIAKKYKDKHEHNWYKKRIISKPIVGVKLSFKECLTCIWIFQIYWVFL